MDQGEFRELGAGVARELGTLRDEPWRYEHQADGWSPSGRLVSGIAALSIDWHGRAGKLGVAGLGPDRLSRSGLSRSWDINVGPGRGLAVIARDINRRILAAGYLDDLLVARARKDEHDERDAQRAAWLARAAELFGIDPPAGDASRNSDAGKLYLGKFVAGQGYVQNYGWSAGHAGMLDISLSGIPAPVALDMLKVLAAHVARECQCCRMYGPGHHPGLSVTGCLADRGPGDAGEDGSRSRVRALLIEHGAAEHLADAALAEARASRYEVAEVYDGDLIVAVVRWNTQGLGEYTVEIPRKDEPARLSWAESEALFDAWRSKPGGKSWAEYYAGAGIHPAWR